MKGTGSQVLCYVMDCRFGWVWPIFVLEFQVSFKIRNEVFKIIQSMYFIEIESWFVNTR